MSKTVKAFSINNETVWAPVVLTAIVASCFSALFIGNAPWSPNALAAEAERQAVTEKLMAIEASGFKQKRVLFFDSGEPFVLVESETEKGSEEANELVNSLGVQGRAYIKDVGVLRSAFESHQKHLEEFGAITFEIRSAKLDEKSAVVLKNAAPVISSYPYATLITSHKDAAISDDLARARLETIKGFLVEQGVPGEKILGEVRDVDGTLTKRINLKATLRSAEE